MNDTEWYINQKIALVKSYKYLEIGLTGTVKDYCKETHKLLVLLDNYHRTTEYIPIDHIVGIVQIN